jgi:trimeric autotransporter adhesin
VLQVESSSAYVVNQNGWAWIGGRDNAVQFDYPGPGTSRIYLNVHGNPGHILTKNPCRSADGWYIMIGLDSGASIFEQTVVTQSLDYIKSHPGSAVNWNFRGVDFTGADLSGIDFTNADFHGATLMNANFKGSTLVSVQMQGVDLSGIDLTGFDLTGANLTRAELTKINFSGTTLKNSHLEGADLSVGTIFSATTSLDEAYLTSGTFYDVSFNGASLRGADLSKGIFSKSGAASANLKNCDLTGAHLQNAQAISGVDFTGATIAGADFSGNNLASTTFGPPPFSTDPNLIVNFTNCKLNYTTIQKQWNCLNLTNATIIGLPTDLSGLNAAHAVLTGFKLPQAILKRAALDQVQLQGANLAGADLSFASLKGASKVVARFWPPC